MSLLKKVFKIFGRMFKVKTKNRSSAKRRNLKSKANKKQRIASKPKIKIVPKVKSLPQSKILKSLNAAKKKSPPPEKILKTTSKKFKTQNSRSDILGEVTHYFDKIKVCVVRIDSGVLKRGDRVTLDGKSGAFEQEVNSMQVENKDVTSAKKGQLIGLKVKKVVSVGSKVYKNQS